MLQVWLPVAVVCVAAVYHLYFLVRRIWSPLRHLPGPESTELLWGCSKALVKDDSMLFEWKERYGSTFAGRVILGNYKLYTADPRALSHILMHTDTYRKPNYLRHILASLVGGEGVLVAEGEEHRRQRKVMNPSFSLGQIREVTPVFFEAAHQLRDVMNSMLSKAPEDGMELDMYDWVGRAALDVIGQAGFGYRFNALQDKSNELFRAVCESIEAVGKSALLGILMKRFKWLRYLPLEYNRKMARAQATVHRVGMELIRQKKAAVREEMQDKNPDKSSIAGRDVLSALIRANMAADLAPKARMSDYEVLAQISTLIVAGHETTASGLAWTLLSLAQYPQVQDKLRAELQSVEDDAPSMDDLNALPYLDAVLKESMRYHCPVRGTVRIATHSDQIPLTTPIIDRLGRTRESVQVQAGDTIGVESALMNHSREFWGEDAGVFRPERWMEEEMAKRTGCIPGVYAHTMTFLGGGRACIGWRFSVIEMKAIIFTLIRSFDFLPIEGQEIDMKDVIVIRPLVRGEKEKGFRLPLRVRRVQRT